MKHALMIGLAIVTLATNAHADSVVTFEAGAEGWVGPSGAGGATTIDPTGGHPGANMHTVFNNFGITFFNNTSADWIGDYTLFPTATLAIDTKVESIDFIGSPVPRPWLIELRDYDDPPAGFPWVSVWYKFADISEAQHGDWTTFMVTIDDTSATDLPAGWGGYGAENEFAEPILPKDRTFASVLAGVDEVALTTLEPGFFFGFTDFDVRIDNLARAGSAVPTLSEYGLMAMGVLLVVAGGVITRRRQAGATPTA